MIDVLVGAMFVSCFFAIMDIRKAVKKIDTRLEFIQIHSQHIQTYSQSLYRFEKLRMIKDGFIDAETDTFTEYWFTDENVAMKKSDENLSQWI